MKKKVLARYLQLITAIVGLSAVFTDSLCADTVAYWRFEDGLAGANVSHLSADGEYYADIADVSGNGNALSVWQEGNGSGYKYSSEVAETSVFATGLDNDLSVFSTGTTPNMWCGTEAMRTWEPEQFTIEVTFKLENSNGYRTIIGRDSYGAANTAANLAALYFQSLPNNSLAVKFCDVDGNWYEAVAPEYSYTGFDYSSNPEGVGVPWYSMAAASDGDTLNVYLLEHGVDVQYRLIASSALTGANTALTSGLGSGSNWQAGNWSVGRGFFNGNFVDYFRGYLDEIRISDTALEPDELLYYSIIPAGLIVSPESMVLNEEGQESQEISISLEYQPSADVFLQVNADSSYSQLILSAQTLIFNDENWDQPQIFTVTAKDDAYLEGKEQNVDITFDAISLDQYYNDMDFNSVQVIVIDNECGADGYEKSDYNLDCIINIEDFVVFVENWLDCSASDPSKCN